MPKRRRKEVELVVIYTAPSEVAAVMIRGLLECQGIPVMVRSFQIPWYDDIGTIMAGAWGEILVPEKYAQKGRRIIKEYLKSVQHKDD